MERHVLRLWMFAFATVLAGVAVTQLVWEQHVAVLLWINAAMFAGMALSIRSTPLKAAMA